MGDWRQELKCNAGRKVSIVSAGFTGTYTDEGAEFEATALVGKRSLQYPARIDQSTAVAAGTATNESIIEKRERIKCG